MVMIIRDAKYSDSLAIKEITAEHWEDYDVMRAVAQFEEMFSPYFANKESRPHYYVAETAKGEVVGYAGFRQSWLFNNTYELVWINVSKEYEGQGIGKLLTETRIEHIKRLGGTIILLMTRKQKFFEQFGFRRKDAFWEEDDAEVCNPWVLMAKQVGKI